NETIPETDGSEEQKARRDSRGPVLHVLPTDEKTKGRRPSPEATIDGDDDSRAEGDKPTMMTLDAGWRPLKINIRNLIRDFLEMYPDEPEEVVLTESIANALDAHPTAILIELREEKEG